MTILCEKKSDIWRLVSLPFSTSTFIRIDQVFSTLLIETSTLLNCWNLMSTMR